MSVETVEALSQDLPYAVAAPTLEAQGREIVIAPPFAGWTAFRSRNPYGFWSHVVTNGANGEIVMQLGRRGTGYCRYTYGRLAVGWKKQMNAGPNVSLRASFAAGPISIRPNGGHVRARAFLELRRLTDGRRFTHSAYLSSYRTVHLEVCPPTSCAYEVSVFCELTSAYWGNANPYVEIIGRFNRVAYAVEFPYPMGGDDEMEELTDEEKAELEDKAFALSEEFLERELGDEEELARAGSVDFEES